METSLQRLLVGILFLFGMSFSNAQVPVTPSTEDLNRNFGDYDKTAFQSPAKVYYPQTWFHFLGKNISTEGITKDLEAIAGSGISGIQLFHGQFGGPAIWPGVEPITILTSEWENAINHTAKECRRLGLRFTMQNCPGWATSGGPWIEPEDAMRHLVWSRIDITDSTINQKVLPVPQPSDKSWHDYKDITVLAFPTPLDDCGEPLIPEKIESNHDAAWEEYFYSKPRKSLKFLPSSTSDPHWVEVSFPKPVIIRSVEFPSINSFNHHQCYEPGVTVTIQAIFPNGQIQDILHTEMPQSNWQDDYPITLACSEVTDVSKYRISIVNKYDMNLSSLRLYSAARKNSWESEAGWTLRSLERSGASPKQSPKAFISSSQILDISNKMDKDGNLNWNVPSGKWTVLRIGHVNTGKRNNPAPREATGWECNKLSTVGANTQFASYIGRLVSDDGPLAGGLLDGMLLDSWECHTQTWTSDMEAEFEHLTNYSLRKWLPAIFGYVIGDHETTTRFLYDWRSTINKLYVDNFYGRTAQLARENGLSISYETAGGDVFPGDILEYYKYADVPMCEFWQPITDNFVGSSNFKPIKPAASAARLYGKPRLSAEAFTANLTWDERLETLKEVANINYIDGVTHLVFHTYTHNPQTPFLAPGTSFGANIGTPFLRGQTWWKFMPEFTDYLARCGYMLERGKPVSDILWYLGDEINHKPDQNATFPKGFKYDYCNPDILLNRLSVKDGKLVTPEGLSYQVMWLPDNLRMLPQTLEKIRDLLHAGATIIGNAPQGLSTLSGGNVSQQLFDRTVYDIWGSAKEIGIRKVGNGSLISGLSLDETLKIINLLPDVTGDNDLWAHRKTEGADWYFITAPKGEGFAGTLKFRCTGEVELWDPVTGEIKTVESYKKGDNTTVKINLSIAGSCFIVFKHTGLSEKVQAKEKKIISSIPFTSWSLSFPTGWGAPSSFQLSELKPWKELDMSSEGKAFSGTATYSTTFDVLKKDMKNDFVLDLGRVDMVAVVSVNGKKLRTLWSPPYSLDLKEAIKLGKNTLTVEVTGTWFNRLVYDAGKPEEDRKTWTIRAPGKDSELKESGLLGPVILNILQSK